ncbi:MAG: alpha/beta hydrolase [Steroidobacteraceae bacterium]
MKALRGRTGRPARGTAFPLPRPLLALLEPRAVLELGTAAVMWPTLRQAARGDGHPVLLLPGFGTTDTSLEVLRLFLVSRGYHVETWGLGRNRGFDRRFSALVEQKVRFLHHRHGRRVSLVGWSLGGVFAFYAGHVAPDCVRSVISLGSPLHSDPDQPPPPGIRAMYRVLASPSGTATHLARARSRALRLPPPAPSTCVYSETDALVPPEQATLDGNAADHENVRVKGSHIGLPFNAQVLWIVADRLAQAEGAWRPLQLSSLPVVLRRGVELLGPRAARAADGDAG